MGISDADVAVLAARAGAAVVRAGYGAELRRIGKEGRDFATQADIDAEQAIRAVLAEHRPNDAITGEELGADGLGGDADADPAERQWLVDPLCGTANFAAQTPLIAVNVALCQSDQIRAAAVADPIADEVFWCDDSGAYGTGSANDHRRLEPSGNTAIVEVYTSALRGDPDPARLLRSDAFTRHFDARNSSTSLALTWVAAGRRAGYVTLTHEPPLRSVHFAAALGLCFAAGAIVTDLRGRPLGAPTSNGMLAAADAATHAALLDALTAR